MRGETTNKARATQGRDFTGLRFGNITPTDIDGLIEYKGKCYIFIEAKMTGAEMPSGQRIALERLCDDLQKVKPTILILCTHNTPIDKEIDFSKALADKYRYKCAWHNYGKTTKELVTNFIERMDKK
jgi:hypothetical protein